MQKTRRLEILEDSLQKKETAFDARLEGHFADVKRANGQPLNDKRNGGQTLGRWEKQNNGLRSANEGIEKTKAAIEREENIIAWVEAHEIPEALKAMVEAGELTQWRKHPHTFFVPGVEKGRLVWLPKKKLLGHRYADQVPGDQCQKFRDTFNRARQLLALPTDPPQGEG